MLKGLTKGLFSLGEQEKKAIEKLEPSLCQANQPY